ncbi:helix-turn-helix domain-containing protein [Bacillus velezensis]|nr:helix-turn-helix domain-containing protein [Bacillus velezensis]
MNALDLCSLYRKKRTRQRLFKCAHFPTDRRLLSRREPNVYEEASKMASFRSVDELNGAIRTHIYRNKSDLTPAAIEVLKVLSRHAVKTPGVAYLKLATIAELIGKHRVTVIRVIKRLVDLGIIRKEIKYRPVSGGNGANMYVILPAADVTPSVLPRQEAEKPTETKPEAPKRENEAVISQSKLKFLQNTYLCV